MIVRKEIDPAQPLTPSQGEILHNLESRPISPDEDCPELTMEQLAQFRRISAANREERCKQTVTLRLSPQASDEQRLSARDTLPFSVVSLKVPLRTQIS